MRNRKYIRKSKDEIIVSAVVWFVVVLMTVICLLPFLRVLSQAFSADKYVMSGNITIFPKGLTFKHMKFIIDSVQFKKSMWVSLSSTAVYIVVAMVMTIITSYPLSRMRLKGRRWMTLYIAFTLMFNGGIIPTYLVVKTIGVTNTFWALIVPCAISAYNVIILITSFRAVPAEYEEAAHVDGAGNFRILLTIMIPLVKPTLAVLLLFYAVGRWNNWFDALMYINDLDLLTLPLVVRNVINSGSSAISKIVVVDPSPTVSVQASAVMFSIMPILIIYPFLQKYFVKGVMIGGIKG